MPHSKIQSIGPLPKKPQEVARQVKLIAEEFAVSPLACLVRMHKLELIDKFQFEEIKYSTQEACLEELNRCRWKSGFICPKCGHQASSTTMC